MKAKKGKTIKLPVLLMPSDRELAEALRCRMLDEGSSEFELALTKKLKDLFPRGDDIRSSNLNSHVMNDQTVRFSLYGIQEGESEGDLYRIITGEILGAVGSSWDAMIIQEVDSKKAKIFLKPGCNTLSI